MTISVTLEMKTGILETFDAEISNVIGAF